MVKQKKSYILDEVRKVMRLNHYSIHTERSYSNWTKRFILFHGMKIRTDLFVESEKKIETFLSHLAIEKNIAKATQNQAKNALIFLYKRVLEHELPRED